MRASPPPFLGSIMPKPQDSSKPDPLAREVDRLLASLAGAGAKTVSNPEPPASGPGTPSAPKLLRPSTPARRRTDPTRTNLAALWARVALGLVLGVGITQWPYAHACGMGLVQYFSAVVMVLVTGAWIAVAAWSRRHSTSHVIGLLLILWGIALATYEILPRVGYAALRWTWQC
jgi:hypothetical protein